MIHGCEKKRAVGAKTTKLDTFKHLAEHLYMTSKTPGLNFLSAASMKRRWNTYKSRFKRILNAKLSDTGMGRNRESSFQLLLTQKELKAGLSISAKLDKMCPQFARMESLFGEKHNMEAAATTELGAVIDVGTSETPPTSETESDTSCDDEVALSVILTVVMDVMPVVLDVMLNAVKNTTLGVAMSMKPDMMHPVVVSLTLLTTLAYTLRYVYEEA
ncbi:uncharacterized protein IUM83_13067 [Phytophthora cinnamomi]|uniref:uncharacterized protein n=1 Tax=Phytophthora cinnamomi TaxID=4785 RepID=UPI00355A4EC1|nr:hypothetical protein IUM83_13067 [Phytophthora cinnamomi]